VKRFKSLSQRNDLIYEISMGNDHAATAIALQSEVVEDRFRFLSHLYPLKICGVYAPNDLTACEAPYWNHHVDHL